MPKNKFDEQRQSFPMEGTPDAGGGGFEIVCITAGVGNGWEFSADVLRAAVPLFDGVQCFVDHLPMDNMDAFRPVRRSPEGDTGRDPGR